MNEINNIKFTPEVQKEVPKQIDTEASDYDVAAAHNINPIEPATTRNNSEICEFKTGNVPWGYLQGYFNKKMKENGLCSSI